MSSKPVDPEVIRLVGEGNYSLSAKARKRDELGLSRQDVESSILNGHETKRERDPHGEANWIYTIIGQAISGRKVYTAGKVLREGGDTHYVITIEWAA